MWYLTLHCHAHEIFWAFIKHLFEREVVVAGKDDHCVVHGVLLLLLEGVRRFYCDDLCVRNRKKGQFCILIPKISSHFSFYYLIE